MMNPGDPSNANPAPASLPDGNDWLKLRPALRSDLRFEIRRTESQTNYVIEDSTRRKFFQIGSCEFNFIQLLDGKTEVAVSVLHIMEPPQ